MNPEYVRHHFSSEGSPHVDGSLRSWASKEVLVGTGERAEEVVRILCTELPASAGRYSAEVRIFNRSRWLKSFLKSMGCISKEWSPYCSSHARGASAMDALKYQLPR